MNENLIFEPSAEIKKLTHISKGNYDSLYKESISDPNTFWAKHGKRIDWIKPYNIVSSCSYKKDDVSIKWFEDGVLNASANCLDRHLATKGEKTAIIWEGDDPSESKHISYQSLYEEVCKFSNVLKSNGIKKGDRVTIYLPMIPEAAVAMLALSLIHI